jgi:hypothetical protein
MGDRMAVDVDRLRDSGPAFDAVASDVGGVLRQLSAALDAEGTCWGEDALGMTFGAQYGPVARVVRTGFAELDNGIADIASAVRIAAGNAAAADDLASGRLD